MKTILLLWIFISTLFANPLQDAIDRASSGAIIKLQDGLYEGNIIIDKPLTIMGMGKQVHIKGTGKGSVVTIKSSSVILKNLIISNSGQNMQKIDAGIALTQVRDCEISHCRLFNVLYGIDMNIVNNSRITDNDISVTKNEISLRGNALKLYYSSFNTVVNNSIHDSRDVTLNYSHHNLFEANSFTNNRFATHLEMSNSNIFVKNSYQYNSVAMMFMGAKDTQVIGNKILSSRGAAGIGVMIGGVANFVFKENLVRYNAKALYIQGQEKALGMKRYILNNDISYNMEAFHFHASIKDNTIKGNTIYANIDDVVKDVGGNFDVSNVVEYNYWDRYDGFDTNNDGVGDTPYRVYQYGDILWHDNNKIKFFYAAPVMSLLNFLLKLAPFMEPNMIMQDSKPIFR
ncbi:MAG TPA: nitrous oxide reductase family maturation protein NosD [Sulfurimonas autotrophica]|uniref:Nitrous oxide reductase family maturation protein NosD n=1 Tax=Sulfurimonas autotrophica TaxID=202747 RepID=A0A7C3BZZ4_9BACT|nr:nitrous oxide reductase family maturation protein NosD [Sulfurimonas autotrophica]